jgi:hypothetical protein
MSKFYVRLQGHWLALLNVAIGLFNVTNALDAQTVPAPVLLLLGSANLAMGGYAFGSKLAMDRSERQLQQLLEVTAEVITKIEIDAAIKAINAANRSTSHVD